MPRNKTPTALLSPDAFKRNPNRARGSEPQPKSPIGEPPDRLNWGPAKTAIWYEIIGLCPDGVIFSSDRLIVELTTEMFYKLRFEGLGVRGGLALSAVNQLLSCLGRLGLTPADRAKISVAAPDAKTSAFATLDDDDSVDSAFTN